MKNLPHDEITERTCDARSSMANSIPVGIPGEGMNAISRSKVKVTLSTVKPVLCDSSKDHTKKSLDRWSHDTG